MSKRALGLAQPMSVSVRARTRLLRGAFGAAVFVAGCGGPPGGRVTDFPVPREVVPPPGRCRVWRQDDRPSPIKECRNIEYEADPGGVVVYRPDDGSRRLVVCYMSVAERGRIDGVDVYDIDTGDLLEIIQRHGEPPPPGGCQNALWKAPEP